MNASCPDEAAIERFEAARHHLVAAHSHWIFYREIYRSGKDNIDVLNAVTGWGWATIHDLLIDSVILHITRLLDRRHGTLSLHKIIDKMSAPQKTRKQLISDLKEVEDAVETLLVHRHKRVAHNNQECAIDKAKLPDLDTTTFEAGLKLLGALMNKIAEQLGADRYDAYEPVMEPTGTAIVVYLRCGLQAVELGQKAVFGKISKEELFEEVARLA